MRRLLTAVVVAAGLLAGCGEDSGDSDGSPESPSPSEPTQAEPSAGTESEAAPAAPYSGTLQDAYEAARITCADYGVKAVAKEFGSAPTPEAAAAAYGEALSTGDHIQASTDGCLAGFGE